MQKQRIQGGQWKPHPGVRLTWPDPPPEPHALARGDAHVVREAVPRRDPHSLRAPARPPRVRRRKTHERARDSRDGEGAAGDHEVAPELRGQLRAVEGGEHAGQVRVAAAQDLDLRGAE